jgi:hypothetical protein
MRTHPTAVFKPIHLTSQRRTALLSIAMAATLLLGGCQRSWVRPAAPAELLAPPSLPAEVEQAAADALPALILAERAASIAGDEETLRVLWLPDATIIDGRGTADTSDDFRWQGWPALRSRYRLAVFPAPPPPLDRADDGTLVETGVRAGYQRSGDQWTAVQRDGRWWLESLAYSMGK